MRRSLRTTAIPAASVVTGDAAAERITLSLRVGTASTCAQAPTCDTTFFIQIHQGVVRVRLPRNWQECDRDFP
jgi:hypothetical protein